MKKEDQKKTRAQVLNKGLVTSTIKEIEEMLNLVNEKIEKGNRLDCPLLSEDELIKKCKSLYRLLKIYEIANNNSGNKPQGGRNAK